jgi:hypothetical protein
VNGLAGCSIGVRLPLVFQNIGVDSALVTSSSARAETGPRDRIMADSLFDCLHFETLRMVLIRQQFGSFAAFRWPGPKRGHLASAEMVRGKFVKRKLYEVASAVLLLGSPGEAIARNRSLPSLGTPASISGGGSGFFVRSSSRYAQEAATTIRPANAGFLCEGAVWQP